MTTASLLVHKLISWCVFSSWLPKNSIYIHVFCRALFYRETSQLSSSFIPSPQQCILKDPPFSCSWPLWRFYFPLGGPSRSKCEQLTAAWNTLQKDSKPTALLSLHLSSPRLDQVSSRYLWLLFMTWLVLLWPFPLLLLYLMLAGHCIIEGLCETMYLGHFPF